MNQQKNPPGYIFVVYFTDPLKLLIPALAPAPDSAALVSAAGMGGAGSEPGSSRGSPMDGMGCPGSSSAVNQ